MERYTLETLYTQAQLNTALNTAVTNSGLNMGASVDSAVISFVASAVYGYFYDSLVAYQGEDSTEIKSIFVKRLGYDVSVKYLYWKRKYDYVKTLLTSSELSLFQTSKMISHSDDTTKSAGGTLQKTASTPTGVSATTSTDSIDITIGSGTSDGDNDVETAGFVDKYTNAQQKFANATRVEGERSGTILREGSLDELLNVLEKLPSSFADEITKHLQKHFIFDYDGEEYELYD